MNFLISGTNGDIGCSVSELILLNYPNCKIFGCDSNKPIKFNKKIHYFKFPRVTDTQYQSFLKKKLEELKINLFIPTIHEEIIFLSKSNKINKDKILINNFDLIEIFSKKITSISWLKNNSFPTLKTKFISEANNNDLPVVIKPNIGSGSKNIYFCKNKKLLDALKFQLPNDFISQEMLDENLEEFTVPLIKINKHYNFCSIKRTLFGGISNKIEVVQNNHIKKFIEQLVLKLPDFCFINLQLKIKNKTVYVFEINPRISSTIHMRHALGFKDLCELINYKMNKKVNLNFKIKMNHPVYRKLYNFHSD